MSSGGFWGVKTFCLVTGASQGIGRTLSVEFAKKFGPGSCLLLTARSKDGLETTKQLIHDSVKEITVELEIQDLSKPELESYRKLMKLYRKEGYCSYVLVHNAGTEGSGKLTSDMTDLEEWQSYMNLNLYSVTMLTSAFLEGIATKEGTLKTIINITSLAAVQTFAGLGYYCIGKASREMYFRTLAVENPQLRVLSYSPGPVDTDMVARVIDKLQVDETKNAFTSMRDNSVLLSPATTISKLVGILETSSFTSGDRIDYFND